MNVIYLPAECQFDLRNLDAVIIILRTADEHIEEACTVLSLLHKAGVTLNLKKCMFDKEKISYLEHVICPRLSNLASLTIHAKCDLKPPRQVRTWSQFGIYRMYTNASFLTFH